MCLVLPVAEFLSFKFLPTSVDNRSTGTRQCLHAKILGSFHHKCIFFIPGTNHMKCRPRLSWKTPLNLTAQRGQWVLPVGSVHYKICHANMLKIKIKSYWYGFPRNMCEILIFCGGPVFTPNRIIFDI